MSMRQVVSCGILWVLAACGAMAEDRAGPRDLTPVTLLQAPAHPAVEIVRDGAAKAVVYVVDPQPSENLKVLAAEFVDVIQARTGATIERVTEAPAAGQPAVIIGDCEETRRAGIDAAALPIEGFEILTAPNRVYIVGSTQPLPAGSNQWAFWSNDGTAWGVADFLERFAEVRWYWPTELGGRSIVADKSLVVPPTHYRDQPVFRMRRYHPTHEWNKLPIKAQNVDKRPIPFAPGVVPEGLKTIPMPTFIPLVRGGNSWPYQVKCHEPQGFHRRHPPEWFEPHQEMFQLSQDGTRDYSMLCYSSQATFDYLIQGCVDAWDLGKPASATWVTPTCMTVSPGDKAVTCYCKECRATMAKAGGTAVRGGSTVMGLFTKRICEEVKKRWPDKKVVFLPYWNYQGCPADIEFPDNLEIWSCTVGGPMALRQQGGTKQSTEANLRAWSDKIGRPIALWDYSDRGSGWTFAPVQFPYLVQDFYARHRDVIIGTFINGESPVDWTTSSPTIYIWMRSLWNPDLDVDAVLDEMCRRLYGPAAGTVRQLIAVQCDCWTKSSWRVPLRDHGGMPPEVFREIWTPEKVAALKALRDKAMAETEADPVARRRLLYWTWTFDEFLKEAEKVLGGAAAPG